MALSEFLASVIACPAPDHGRLVATQDSHGNDLLTCESCGKSFPIRDGIPVLLLSDAVNAEAAGQ